jgi:hypothetical protein
MVTSSTGGVRRRESPVFAIVTIGLAVGILDGLAAILHAALRTGTSPELIFRYIASALLGESAYSGGNGMVALGIFLHFVIALIWSAVFFVAYPRVRLLQRNKWLVGFGYGIFVWLMMTFVVLPLTALPAITLNWRGASIGILIHMFVVGLTIVVMTRRWFA